MTTHEVETFIASVPWRTVKMVEVGDTGKTPTRTRSSRSSRARKSGTRALTLVASYVGW
jgi:hypothetical protein